MSNWQGIWFRFLWQ